MTKRKTSANRKNKIPRSRARVENRIGKQVRAELKNLESKKTHRFLKSYFVLVIIFAIFSIIDSLFISGTKSVSAVFNSSLLFWVLILSLLEIAVFILSVIALVKICRGKLQGKFLVVPIVFILTFLFFILLPLNAVVLKNGFLNPTVLIASIIISVFELIFAVFMLKITS